MGLFTDEVIRDLLSKSLETATIDASGWHDIGRGPGSSEGAYIDWLTFKSEADSVIDDVRRIRNHPLVPVNIPIFGYVYDVKTGKLIEAPEATRIGRSA